MLIANNSSAMSNSSVAIEPLDSPLIFANSAIPMMTRLVTAIGHPCCFSNCIFPIIGSVSLVASFFVDTVCSKQASGSTGAAGSCGTTCQSTYALGFVIRFLCVIGAETPDSVSIRYKNSRTARSLPLSFFEFQLSRVSTKFPNAGFLLLFRIWIFSPWYNAWTGNPSIMFSRISVTKLLH